MAANPKALFITYDGLLDPLGGSQILPYIRSISEHCAYVHVLSFEKRERPGADRKKLARSLQDQGIGWTPLRFSSTFGAFSKIRDLLFMSVFVSRLQAQHQFDILHCRSYQAMAVGAVAKRFSRVRVIFDMRGFWVDDRFDGGAWKRRSAREKSAYQLLKRIERSMLESADATIVLTQAAEREVRRLAPNAHAPIWIIPCCADYQHFQRLVEERRASARERLGLASSDFVISYLGSLGGLYELDSMLKLFQAAARRDARARFLVITKDWRSEHEAKLDDLAMRDLRERIVISSASREEVPGFLGVSDVMLCFYRKGFSRRGTSPTKVGEALACGVPVLCSSEVGDLDRVIRDLNAGDIIDLDVPEQLESAANDLPRIAGLGGQSLRERSRPMFGLEVAADRYRELYEQLRIRDD
jgi:glycosyltransferase involved in cell wall biosynthesis